VARKIATAMQARYFSLKELSREKLIRIVRTTAS
jgi:Mg-chelatase subunit ChlD